MTDDLRPAPGAAVQENLNARTLDLFEAALEQPSSARDAWLQRECAGEPELFERVRSLLRQDAQAAGQMPTALPYVRRTTAAPPPDRIGAYRLGPRLGAGGMGVVYRAERDDGLFEHTVAVKLISVEVRDPAAEDRFNLERRALARLTHPHIARLLDGGVTQGGAPYILMEFVEGLPITEMVAAVDSTDDEIVELMLQVCSAVAEAHRKLVVHGDLKPSNVLVSRDRSPDQDGRRTSGQVRLVDFGVARLLDHTDDQPLRSPVTAAYADPARASGDPPTTADDVYAIGVMLRELVARSGPTMGDGAPPRHMPADLGAIADKATAPQPADRYGSVDALAEDLARWRRKEPVSAQPRSARYLLARFAARRPRFSIAATLAAVGLVAALIGTTTLYLRAERERREADHRFAEARGMAHYMLFNLFDALNRTPGTVEIRRELVDTSRGYLAELAASPRAPTDLKAEVGLGYLRLAGVLGLYGAGNLGQRDEARAMLRKAEQSLANAPPGADADAAWQHALGRLRLYQGFETLVQGAGARAAEPLLAQAVTRLRRADVLGPGDPEVLADLWEARLTQADLQGSDNHYKAEEAILRGELQAYPARRSAMARHDKTPLLLARTLKYLADARYYQEDKAGSVRYLQQALPILQAENTSRPGRTRTVIELMDGWWNLASSLGDLGRKADALALYDKALDLGRSQLSHDPESDNLVRQVRVVELDRAGLLASIGRRREALADARASLAQYEDAAAAKPNDLLAQRTYLAALRPFADVERVLGMKPQACADYRRVDGMWRQFARRFGVNAKLQQTELKGIQEQIAKCA